MIKWCKCIKYYNTKESFSSLSLKPGQYFECFVGEKFRYKKIGKKNYFIDTDCSVHDEYFIEYFIDVTAEMRQQKIDYILN